MATSQEDIITKLRQIEEQARQALHELGPGTPNDRVRLIMGLAGHLALKLEIEYGRQARVSASNDADGESRTA